MNTTDKKSMERIFLSREINALAEERTVLAYIRTELAFLGIVALILRFYLEKFQWSLPIAIVLFVIFGILLVYEIGRIKALRKRRQILQKKHEHLKKS